MVAAAVLVGVLATALVVVVPAFRFAYRAEDLHVALETAAALIALLAAYLVLGRFRRDRRLDDLLLCYGLTILGLSNLLFVVVPAIADEGGSSRFETWAALSGRLLGTTIFAASAFAPRRRVRLTGGQRAVVALSIPALLGCVAAGIALAGSALPQGVETLFPPEESGRPRLDGAPALLGVQLAAIVLYVLAAVGFRRRAERENDKLAGWLAVASVFGGFSALNYFFYPSLYTDWVYTGDAFRLAFKLAILIAAINEIGSYWERISRAAVLEERRRIARDLHDGIAQELAFIRRNLHRLDDGDPTVDRLKASADRALGESRRAYLALSGSDDEPFDRALARALRETADREGTEVALRLAPDVKLDELGRDALIRIACEAVTNAARHGGARLVTVELRSGRRLVLRVSDDGRGFDPDLDGRHGFGILSMRERAASVGGDLALSSAPGAGTTVEVAL